MQPLNSAQQPWVDKTLSKLSLEECVAQILLPKIDNDASVDQLLRDMEKIPFGGLFVWGAEADTHRRRLARIQAASPIPVVVAADLENGAGYVVHGMTQFPDTMAVAAADREELAYAMGKASAIGGRSVGIHWTFAPVVDVNVHPDNPIANSRSLGDHPDRVSRFASAIVRGMQDHGLAACAKHFPGDGIDDLDQHISTSVNSLSLEDWKRISGRAFSAAFAAGSYSTMIGHIALPAWDGETDRRGALRPATVSRRITTDLLRGEMKFEGLAVTDDMNMGGVAGYMNARDRVVGCIAAGCDMLLFPYLERDYKVLLAAIRSGELTEERVREAARRILEFKARLNLHTGERCGPAPTAAQQNEFDAASRQMAEGAIACARNTGNVLPLRELKRGDRVLTITLTNDCLELHDVDRELAARGFSVEHITNPGCFSINHRIGEFAAIFVNFTFKAHWGVGSPRSVGPHNRLFMGGIEMEHPRVIFTSFGSPYVLRQFMALPNLVNTHSSSPISQRAAVAAWLGEIPMTAKSPVQNLERTFQVG